MATTSDRVYQNAGSEKKVEFEYTGTTSYSQTTGDVITAASLGLSSITDVPTVATQGIILNPTISSDSSQVAIYPIASGPAAFNGTATWATADSATSDPVLGVVQLANNPGKYAFITENTPLTTVSAASTGSPTREIRVLGDRVTNNTVNCIFDGAPAGTQVYFRPTSQDLRTGILVSDQASAAVSSFEDTTNTFSFVIMYDTTPDEGSFPIYFDDGAAAGSRIQINHPYETDCFIGGLRGENLKITHDATAATNPAIFLNTASAAENRLEANLAGAANSTALTGTINALPVLNRYTYVGNVYYNPNETKKSEALIADLTSLGAPETIGVVISDDYVVNVKHNAVPSAAGTIVQINTSTGALVCNTGGGAGSFDSSVQQSLGTSTFITPSTGTDISVLTSNTKMVVYGY